MSRRQKPKIELFVDYDKFQGEKVYNQISDIVNDCDISTPALIGLLERIKFELLIEEMQGEEETND